MALIALASLGLAGGLWVSHTDIDAASVARIIELEAQLKDARAQLSCLEDARATPAPGFMPASVAASSGSGSPQAPYGSPRLAGNGIGNPSATALPQPMGLQPVPQQPFPPPATVVQQPQDAATIKKLAEAEARYADLISKFNLQPDEREFFKQIAARRASIRKEATAKLQDPTLSDKERATMLADAKGQLDTNDQEVRSFLNDDEDFKKFALWEQTELEREQLESGRGVFDNNNSPLSAEQEEWLVLATHQLRQNTQGVADPYNMDSMVGATIDQGYVERVLKKFDSDTEILLQNARSRFSAPQLKALRAYRAQQRVAVEARLWNMARTTSGAR